MILQKKMEKVLPLFLCRYSRKHHYTSQTSLGAELNLGMLRMNLFLLVEGWQPGILRPDWNKERLFIFSDVFMFGLGKPADATECRSKMCSFTLLEFLATTELF